MRASRYPPAALTSPEEPGDAVFGSGATALIAWRAQVDQQFGRRGTSVGLEPSAQQQQQQESSMSDSRGPVATKLDPMRSSLRCSRESSADVPSRCAHTSSSDMGIVASLARPYASSVEVDGRPRAERRANPKLEADRSMLSVCVWSAAGALAVLAGPWAWVWAARAEAHARWVSASCERHAASVRGMCA